MALIKVTSENLHTTSTRLTSGATELDGNLSQLKALVDSMGAEWQGAGSQAFAQLYDQFNTAGRQLRESLAGIATMLSQAATHYQESEDQVASSFARSV
jgi:WXG100 family type VII secretion target